MLNVNAITASTACLPVVTKVAGNFAACKSLFQSSWRLGLEMGEVSS